MFPSLLAPRCQLPVGEGQDKELAAPGTISFAPPNYHLLLERDGTCSLSVDEPVHHSRPSIDVLFESAAWATDGEALGILLSGANADGAAGLAALVDAGGIAWIQDPESAPMDAMPRAGIAQGRAHRVLSVQEMAAVLARLTAGQRLASGVMS
jgi:two-component system chemotaxis response regulator CheB